MTNVETRRIALARTMAALVALSTLALASQAQAADGPDPMVVADKSALPRDCVSLGEVSGRHADETPRPERAQAEAVREAKSMGATYVVTGSAERCGGNSYCYDGVAYRCPAPGGASAGK
jgi:hypothetical protein